MKINGQSLIQVIVSIGILSAMALTFASLIATQQKETKALTEKLASLDLEKLLITSLADGSICTGELSNPLINPLAPFTINATNPAWLLHLVYLLR